MTVSKQPKNIFGWWKNKKFIAELDARYKALEDGTDKGVTLEQLTQQINKLRKKKYS